MKRNILVSGGAGFIGSHSVRLLVNKYPEYHIINMDVLTYAGNLENLKDIENKENYTFVKCNICDFKKVKQVFVDYKIDSVIHLAASLIIGMGEKYPKLYYKNNVLGTKSLLTACINRTMAVLTDVYGTNTPTCYFQVQKVLRTHSLQFLGLIKVVE